MHTRDIKPIGVNTKKKNSHNSHNSYQSIDPQSLDGTDLKAPKKPIKNHSGIIFRRCLGSNKIKDSSWRAKFQHKPNTEQKNETKDKKES